jgi:hypothetical protein
MTRNGGRTWTLIKTFKGNPGAYLDTIRPVSMDKKKCKVKVVLKDRKGKTIGSDVSDGTFSILK